MTEQGEQDGGEAQSRYEHFRVLPRAGIEAHLEGLTSEAQHIMGQYAPGDTLRGDHNARLTGCIGDLLPMIHNESVQSEVVAYRKGDDPHELLFNRIQSLNIDIMTFMGHVQGTGVEVFYTDQPLD